MTGMRKSTRLSQSTSAKYTVSESSSSEETAKTRKDAQTTRRKRARVADGRKDDQAQGSPPPSKRVHGQKRQPEKTTKPPSPVLPASRQLASNSAFAGNGDWNGDQEVFWLLKAEPLPRYENGVNVAFSIDDLAACSVPEPWSGVRNHQARNNMQAMRKGDLGFFYHSNAKPSGVVGILRVAEEAKVDESAFDNKDPYYDPKSDREKPKWYCVGVEFVRKFDDVVDLAQIKSHATNGGPLECTQLVTHSRLSVCKVSKEEWDFVLGLAGAKGATADVEDKGATEVQS